MDEHQLPKKAHDRCSMLLEFRAENVRSFAEPIEFSLLGTRVSQKELLREIPWRENGKAISVLPVAGVFGANASGKSNLLRAMSDMRNFVLYSFRHGTPNGKMPTRPYLLGSDEAADPSSFEIDLVLNGVRHEYGFHVHRNGVRKEWARSYPRGRSVLIFEREGQKVHLGSSHRSKGRATQEILRENALFLSTAGATEHPALLPLFQWFQRNLLFADVDSRRMRQALTADMLEHDSTRERVLELLREADLGIAGAKKRELDPEIRRKVIKALGILRGEEGEAESSDDEIDFDDFEVRLIHSARGSDNVELLPTDESRGTLVWFGMIGPVIEALRDGSLLLADELDASLHPALVNALVALFQSQQSNPNRAQLVFNSHDVTLMGDSESHPLARDQIWFTEKSPDGSSRLYPLTDLDPRRDEATSRRYLAGRYGATPIVSTSNLEHVAHEVAAGTEA